MAECNLPVRKLKRKMQLDSASRLSDTARSEDLKKFLPVYANQQREDEEKLTRIQKEISKKNEKFEQLKLKLDQVTEVWKQHQKTAELKKVVDNQEVELKKMYERFHKEQQLELEDTKKSNMEIQQLTDNNSQLENDIVQLRNESKKLEDKANLCKVTLERITELNSAVHVKQQENEQKKQDLSKYEMILKEQQKNMNHDIKSAQESIGDLQRVIATQQDSILTLQTQKEQLEKELTHENLSPEFYEKELEVIEGKKKILANLQLDIQGNKQLQENFDEINTRIKEITSQNIQKRAEFELNKLEAEMQLAALNSELEREKKQLDELKLQKEEQNVNADITLAETDNSLMQETKNYEAARSIYKTLYFECQHLRTKLQVLNEKCKVSPEATTLKSIVATVANPTTSTALEICSKEKEFANEANNTISSVDADAGSSQDTSMSSQVTYNGKVVEKYNPAIHNFKKPK